MKLFHSGKFLLPFCFVTEFPQNGTFPQFLSKQTAKIIHHEGELQGRPFVDGLAKLVNHIRSGSRIFQRLGGAPTHYLLFDLNLPKTTWQWDREGVSKILLCRSVTIKYFEIQHFLTFCVCCVMWLQLLCDVITDYSTWWQMYRFSISSVWIQKIGEQQQIQFSVWTHRLSICWG